nr:MAG TPA: hypothetical protein [Inoviridae sp.]
MRMMFRRSRSLILRLICQSLCDVFALALWLFCGYDIAIK